MKKTGFYVNQRPNGSLVVHGRKAGLKGWHVIASISLKGVSGDTLLAWYETVTSTHQAA